MPNANFREAFLHYIWQHQYFDKKNLFTTEGESIQVLSPGFINKNSGPDFYNCRLLIQQIEWHGTVEVHYKTSDWDKHKHTIDKAYNNVVLHLVWEEDYVALREDGTKIPTLELKSRVQKSLIERYKMLVDNPNSIPCSNSIQNIDELFVLSMIDRTLVERMETKASDISSLLKKNKNDWEETCYQWLGKCFGFKINSDPFLQLCTSLPYSILKKYHTKPLQTEALLFGIAGFLTGDSEEDYFVALKKEFEYLNHKLALKAPLEISEWKFLRLRPANFPTLRIAQFAGFLTQLKSLFDFVFDEQTDSNHFKTVLACKTNLFWNSHFHFEKSAKLAHEAEMGQQSIESILINAIVPLRFAHAMYHQQDSKDDGLELLRQLKPEKNNILTSFSALKIAFQSAYESQALLQLHNNYCLNKMCLSCTIGHQIIYPSQKK